MAKYKYNTNIPYNYGSTAPLIQEEVYHPRVPSKPRQEGPRVQRKIEQAQAFKRKAFVFMCVTAIFCVCAAFVWGCAAVSYKQHELKQAKLELRDLKNQVNTTKALIASSTNLDYVRDRAIAELNMTEPLSHQIVYLDILKTSYTVVELEAGE